jgi:hypothetical protein
MAGTLTPSERLARQRGDHNLVAALDAADCPIGITGHRTAEDARANQSPVQPGDPVPPAHYRVVYDFDTLSGPGRLHRPTIVHVAPNASGGYPATAPSSWVISRVIPWTPHFAANVPICHGTHVWRANRTQLVDYIIHLGKLLNFDEPPPTHGYHGYNRAAIAHWRNHMKLKPLDPTLRFPMIRLEDVLRAGMRRAQDPAPAAGRFRPAPQATPAPLEGRMRRVVESQPS